MRTTKQPHFTLQQVLAATIQQTQTYGSTKIQVIDDFVASISLIGQAQQLQNVLCLLISNAMQTPTQKIIVTTKQLLQTDKNVLLEFSVTDEITAGCNKHRTQHEASLALLLEAEGLIATLGGKSERINRKGAGVGLKFILKYEWLQPEAQTEVTELWPQPLAGKRILVVEDNEINQLFLTKLITKQGIKTDVAADGKTAIDLIEKNEPYDLIMMDLQMPHMNGFEATNYIRKKLHSHVPIIAMTPSSYSEEQAECLNAGMNHYLAKPFTPEALKGVLHYFLMGNHPLLHNNFEVIRHAG